MIVNFIVSSRKKYLKRNTKDSPDLVANIILLTSKSNIYIRDKAPARYLQEIIEEIGRPELEVRLRSNLVPSPALDAALADDYTAFLDIRSRYLHEHAERLTGAVVIEDPAIDANDDDSHDVED